MEISTSPEQFFRQSCFIERYHLVTFDDRRSSRDRTQKSSLTGLIRVTPSATREIDRELERSKIRLNCLTTFSTRREPALIKISWLIKLIVCLIIQWCVQKIYAFSAEITKSPGDLIRIKQRILEALSSWAVILAASVHFDSRNPIFLHKNPLRLSKISLGFPSVIASLPRHLLNNIYIYIFLNLNTTTAFDQYTSLLLLLFNVFLYTCNCAKKKTRYPTRHVGIRSNVNITLFI